MKEIKRMLSFLIITIAIVATSAGCDVKKPGDTLMTPPKLGEVQKDIKAKLQEIMPEGSKMLTPISGENRGAIQMTDLDNDGENEAIAFFYSENTENPLNVVILKNEKNAWRLEGRIKEKAESIDRVEYLDMSGNGDKEIFIGWKMGMSQNKGLGVYGNNEGVIEEIFNALYREMIFIDSDDDGSKELVLINLDRLNMEADAKLYVYSEGSINHVDTAEMDGAINGYENIVVGNADTGHKGIFLDEGVGAHSSQTELLIVKDEKIRNVFYDQEKGINELTFKSYMSLSKDFDSDGIIEISTLAVAPGYEYASMAGTLWLTDWYRWDGDKNLNKVGRSYFNYIDGYNLIFSDEWKDHITIEMAPQDSEKRWVDFYYIDAEKDIRGKLFTIHAFDQNNQTNDLYETDKELLEVGRNLNKVYMVEFYPEEQSKVGEMLKLSPEEIEAALVPIDGLYNDL